MNDRLLRLERQLRSTQLAFGACLVSLLCVLGSSCDKGTPSTLQVAERIEIGPNGELVLSAESGRALITSPQFQMGCLGDTCTMRLGMASDEMEEGSTHEMALLSSSGTFSMRSGDKMLTMSIESANPMLIANTSEDKSFQLSAESISIQNGESQISMLNSEQPRLSLMAPGHVHYVPPFEEEATE